MRLLPLLWLLLLVAVDGGAAARRPVFRRGGGKGGPAAKGSDPEGALYPQHTLVHPYLDGTEIPNWGQWQRSPSTLNVDTITTDRPTD